MEIASRTTLLLLILIILLGAGLRIHHLDAEDLWHDEISTVNNALKPWSEVELEPFNVTHFLFNIFIMHFWLKLGTTAFIIRLFSALVGIATIPVIYLIGLRLFDEKVGLLSALILALSSYHIYYSQEARAYALQVFLILLIVYFFYRTIETDKLQFWIITTVISIFTIYLQAITFITWIALNIYYIWRLMLKKEKFRITPWFISQWAVLIVCTPYLIYLTRPEMSITTAWIPRPTIQDIGNTFEFFTMGWVYWVLPQILVQFFVPLFIFFLFLSGLIFKNSARKISLKLERNQEVIFVWYLFAIPFMLFYLISFKKPTFLSYRYLIIILPFFYMLVAHGISKLENRTIKFIAVCLLLSGMAVGLRTHYHEVKKIPWSEIAQYLDKNGQKTDMILIHEQFWETALSYYLKSSIPVQRIILEYEPKTNLSTVVVGHPRTWLITVTFEGKKPPEEIHTTLEKPYQEHKIIFTKLVKQPGEAQVSVELYSNPIK